MGGFFPRERGGSREEGAQFLPKLIEIVPRLLNRLYNQNACTVRHEPGVRDMTLGLGSLLVCSTSSRLLTC